MPKRATTAARRSRTPRTPTDPLTLRIQFTQLVVRKHLEHGKEFGETDADGGHHGGGGSHVAAARTLLDRAIDVYLRFKWCRDVERALDSGIKLLQEHGDEMTEEQREGLRNDLADLLGDYGDIC